MFYEFEHRGTYAAKVANALDKLEVQLQHNHSDLSTSEEMEFEMSYILDIDVLFDKTLLELKNQIETAAKLKKKLGGIDTDKIRRRRLLKRQSKLGRKTTDCLLP